MKNFLEKLRKTGKRAEYPKTPIKDPNEKYLIIGSYTSLYGFSSYKIRNRISVDFSICPDEASVQEIYQALYGNCSEKMNMEKVIYQPKSTSEWENTATVNFYFKDQYAANDKKHLPYTYMSDVYHTVLHDGDYLCIRTTEYSSAKAQPVIVDDGRYIDKLTLEQTTYENIRNTKKDNGYITHDVLAISADKYAVQNAMMKSIYKGTLKYREHPHDSLTYHHYQKGIWEPELGKDGVILKCEQWQLLEYSSVTNSLIPVLS